MQISLRPLANEMSGKSKMLGEYQQRRRHTHLATCILPLPLILYISLLITCRLIGRNDMLCSIICFTFVLSTLLICKKFTFS